MQLESTLDLGDPVIGIDPGGMSTGVCLMSSGGKVLKKRSIRGSKTAGHFRNLLNLWHEVRVLFDEIEAEHGRKLHVGIEDGIFGVMKGQPAGVSIVKQSKAGEIRGVIVCLCWSHGWRVTKIAPLTWKSKLPSRERGLKKTLTAKEYADFYAAKLGIEFASADEADATMIAAYMTGAQ